MAQLPSAQRVYEETKEQILSGELPGGTLLSENEVARRLQVSRTPAREAFVRLEAEGLLSLQPRRGAVVVPVPINEAVDVLEVREALEVGAVRRLARRPDRSRLLASAHAELQAQRVHVKARDLEAFAVSDHAFHRAIVDAGGNAVASHFYATLGDRQRRMTAQAIGADLHLLGDLRTQHQGLLRRAEAGQVDSFASELRTHFEVTHRVLLPGL
ncbi:MAG: GntR family transcriptional regulator [Acidobacteriota bacterium]|nr:GntR family transcriptional regulator [Acidobacteriota bacterium]